MLLCSVLISRPPSWTSGVRLAQAVVPCLCRELCQRTFMTVSADCHRPVTGDRLRNCTADPRMGAVWTACPHRSYGTPSMGQNEPVPSLLLIEDDDAIRTALEL